MAFTNTVLNEYAELGSGEVLRSKPSNVDSFSTFEDGLIFGRFAKYDTGSLDNLDNSATPTIAGIVNRDITQPTGVNTYDSTRTPAGSTSADCITFGFATVDVVTGDTPARYGVVYATNDGLVPADYGKATTTSLNNEATNWVFLEEVQTDVWLVARKEMV
jgi:hypothetical protein